MNQLTRKLIELCRHGKARCGSGFGKYPLGVREAVVELMVLVEDPNDRAEVQQALDEFDRRLEQ